MRYSFVSAAIVALVSSVVGQTAGFDEITSPTQDENFNAGSSFDIVWVPAGVSGTVTITLLQGATFNTLQIGPVVAASIDNTLGKFTYTVPSSSSFATYGFKILLDSTANDATPTFQYSRPFHIVGGSSSVSGSGSISSSATGSGSSSGPTTTTVHLSTNPSFTSSVVSSTSASTSSTNTSSTSSTLANSTSSSSLSKTTSTGTKTSATSTGSSSTSSSATAATHNAAVANIVTGGMAMIGGMVLALAL